MRLPGRRFAALVILGCCLLLPASPVAARIGGGESFGGGGGGGWGGGGWDGGGEGFDIVVYLLIRLCFQEPVVGVPLLAVVIAIWVKVRSEESRPFFRSGEPPTRDPGPPAPRDGGLAALRQRDPNFSQPLFLDFFRLLYTRVQEARGRQDFAPVRPYVSDSAWQTLVRQGTTRTVGVSPAGDVRLEGGLTGVDDVIIGAARIQRATVKGGRAELRVRVEANVTEHRQGRTSRTLYLVEVWTLSRRAEALSRGPDEIRALDCPSCGSPVELEADGRCRSCREVVTDGRFRWRVERIVTLERRAPRTPELTLGGGRERGLDRPTVLDPHLAARRREFAVRYPTFSWPRFESRVRRIFLELNAAWSSKEWSRARPYQTDPLFDTHRFWIESYRREGLTNVTEEIQIDAIQPVKIETDAFFDAITVRIHARMLDYTLRDTTGEVVAGDRTEPRIFSEYWTFLRRSGFDPEKDSPPDRCPSCAAPLKINRAGVCEYCDSLVTSGEFDWVLSAIHQDEVYRG